MKNSLLTILTLVICHITYGQSNIISTNKTAENVLIGDYNPQDYFPSIVIDDPKEITSNIIDNVSPDSLKSYLFRLREFENRNTGSDTISDIIGMGAARRWALEKFNKISEENENRLLTSYLQFDANVCNMSRHKNVFAVLPGLDNDDHGVIVIEAHMDSRCEGECDIDCEAHGMEDNGSGTALVLELARVMSKMAFDKTIVFLITTGEEQGLYGASAFAQYAKIQDIPLIAVFNNDVIGGVICGMTSSAPSCPGFNHIDSTQVRLFSSGTFNSKHKQLSRFIKLQYIEEALEFVKVPMQITIMSAEDRTGRGGDHIPFRQQGFPAMRFTSANEHGNVDVSNSDYTDRQHSTRDILGLDTDGDNTIDSFFVDFNYLARNSAINGVAASMAAIGPKTPEFTAMKNDDSTFVEINDPFNYGKYRVFLRTTSNDFDSLFTTEKTKFTFEKPSAFYYVSVASVDENGIESLFSGEVIPSTVSGINEVESTVLPKIELLQNRPNPFDESTVISFFVNEEVQYRTAYLSVSDLTGKEVWRKKVELNNGMNEILYEHGYNATGTFNYSIIVDNQIFGTKQMIFAN